MASTMPTVVFSSGLPDPATPTPHVPSVLHPALLPTDLLASVGQSPPAPPLHLKACLSMVASSSPLSFSLFSLSGQTSGKQALPDGNSEFSPCGDHATS